MTNYRNGLGLVPREESMAIYAEVGAHIARSLRGGSAVVAGSLAG